MKTQQTFQSGSVPDLENRLYLRQLAFERAMDRFDIEAANVACAQADYFRREIARAALAATKPTP